MKIAKNRENAVIKWKTKINLVQGRHVRKKLITNNNQQSADKNVLCFFILKNKGGGFNETKSIRRINKQTTKRIQ